LITAALSFLQVGWSILTSRIGLAACTFAVGYGLCWWQTIDDAALRAAKGRAEALQRDLDAARLAAKYDEVILTEQRERATKDRKLIDDYAAELAKREIVPEPVTPEPPPAPTPAVAEPTPPLRIPALPRRPDPCRLTDHDIGRLRPIGQ